MRGKDNYKSPFDDVGGITPACAGKSKKDTHAAKEAKDHPRVCGEKGTTEMCKLHKQGSPPRVRGKEKLDLPSTTNSRITPACAGKRIKWAVVDL